MGLGNLGLGLGLGLAWRKHIGLDNLGLGNRRNSCHLEMASAFSLSNRLNHECLECLILALFSLEVGRLPAHE